jgi:hypothetical protein
MNSLGNYLHVAVVSHLIKKFSFCYGNQSLLLCSLVLRWILLSGSSVDTRPILYEIEFDKLFESATKPVKLTFYFGVSV